jgi:hypothetical protein
MAEYEAYQQRQQILESLSEPTEEKQPTRAERARKALAAADTALHDANKVYGAGATADLSEAQRRFSVALAHLKRRNYGAVLQAAEQVQQEVRKAMNAARAEAAKRERKRYEAPTGRPLPDIWTATFSKDRSDSSPGRPSLGSSSGRSGFGESRSHRGK